MAVQAQYPSNVLLLNRNGQDQKNLIGNDYSLQPQLSGFLDQSHMFFNNGVVANPRKRGRETVATASATAQINLFSLQSQPQPTLVNLSQLHNQQPNIVSTGLRLAFGEQQLQQQQQQEQLQQQQHQRQQQQQQPQQQQQQQSCFPSSYSTTLTSFLSEELAPQIKQQRDEIEQFLQAQGEQLRRTLAERRQRHYRALLGAAEESASRRLREKDAEVEKAVRLNAELEQRVAQLRVEAQVWEAKARAQEATAATLQAQLQQAMMGGVAENNRADDGESGGCCEGHAEDAESAHIDPDRVVESLSSCGPMCKACWKRAASVVLMPCRHLCVCTGCDAAVDVCPLCYCPRSDSVEVFLS
ncbi:BOI-related E3 ubiquitin-protein ligase 1-like [Macadamia integrifolia]|uniref:BOI-related E3 ubiquitin-protein ligase 1-like n=1 Tax=Macadamia integrifolia TaxID=60698 RepID=UPI001C4EC16C|nr:BOI-related E3 ubiquitin-protein ligase 1-like [Macadamia integrifolia]